MSFLPINAKEVSERGWDCVDFVYVSGDAYVDHPSFGTAIISRLVEHLGYTVGIIAQPQWKTAEDFTLCIGERLAASEYYDFSAVCKLYSVK